MQIAVLDALRRKGLLILAGAGLVSVSPVDVAAAENRGGSWDVKRHTVPDEHPRLLGTRSELRDLARQRPQAYTRMAAVAREQSTPDPQRMISLGIVSAVEEDSELARQAIELATKYVDGGVRQGHVPFGHDLAHAALVFDLCHEYWSDDERQAFIAYFNATSDANAGYGRSVFHNGWWGYKHWGIGLAAYATYHENERAASILAELEGDYADRAAPALELAGAGGGWAEGYYLHYWLYEWLLFCEVARRVEGVDYYALAPEFYQHRAVASMFEMYPGISTYNSRRPIPMGDGGGRTFGGDRDKALSARRILVNFFQEDAAHQTVHAYNEKTNRSSVGVNAYMDFLWHDPSISNRSLDSFPLSHRSAGAGHIHARSDWSEEATYFFFKMSDRFTSHQHLDAGHFLIYRHAELAGKGGHYDSFGSSHDVNYHMRSIAHNTLLVHDANETWPGIRAGSVTGNDGGQHHNWPHHNGSVDDPQEWHANRELYDIVDLLAFEDTGAWLYVAGDATRAYSPDKLELFTRQIVYIRPGTFVIFDHVRATTPEFEKTWLLQAMREPVEDDGQWVITNGDGRLFVQTLLPLHPTVRIFTGENLYRYDNQHYPPSHETGPAPEARMHVSTSGTTGEDYFLHVLRATDADVDAVNHATAEITDDEIVLIVDGVRISFMLGSPGGWIQTDGMRLPLALQR